MDGAEHQSKVVEDKSVLVSFSYTKSRQKPKPVTYIVLKRLRTKFDL